MLAHSHTVRAYWATLTPEPPMGQIYLLLQSIDCASKSLRIQKFQSPNKHIYRKEKNHNLLIPKFRVDFTQQKIQNVHFS